jgi:hypothetical protein
MLDFLVAGFPAGIVVVAIVEAIKRVARIEGDGAIILAVVVGIVVALAAQVAQAYPAFGVWWQTVIAGALLGLAACGLFDAGQAIKAKLQ